MSEKCATRNERSDNMADIQQLFKEIIVDLMGNSLAAELDEEMGYSR